MDVPLLDLGFSYLKEVSMENSSYYLVHGWMVNELNLKGTNLVIFAIIFGFSHDEMSRFTGSLKYLQSCTGVSHTTVLKSLKYLVEEGLISKHRKRVNGIKLVDYSVSKETLEVLKKLYGGTKETLPGGTKETLPHNIIIDNKKISLSENGKSSNKFLPLAEHLARIIRTKKNIKVTTPQLKSWANEIRKLSEMNSVPYERIKVALRWYKKNIGGEYIPVIESGYSLRMKFMKLESAMDREEMSSKKKDSEYDEEYTKPKDKSWMK